MNMKRGKSRKGKNGRKGKTKKRRRIFLMKSLP
jgi:hypothetical protein